MDTIAKILSVQVGKVVTSGNKNSSEFLSKEYTTASIKNPVNTKVEVTKLSIVEDSVADTVHHGGVHKAVFANSINNYNHWKEFLNKDELPYGALGENLTFDTIDESDVCIGDIHKIGSATMQVSQPRQPCWKISRRWEHNDFMQEIYNSGKTGWYYRVLEEGSFQVNDKVELVSQLETKITILEANKTLRDVSLNIKTANKLLDMECLAPAWLKSL
ncbi:MAG: MOSC domain-containing protein, partial [Campylobacterota bacterium]|nr:MOSC domain-containing protein [Campylobacterota bacterium]